MREAQQKVKQGMAQREVPGRAHRWSTVCSLPKLQIGATLHFDVLLGVWKGESKL